MSLKAFHVFFITLATLLAAFFTLWSLGPGAGGPSGTLWTVLGAAGTLGLPVYGVWFLKKTKEVSLI